jgi:hypothetical protein
MSKLKAIGAGGRFAGKKISEIVKRLKANRRAKKSKANIEKAGQGTKSVKKYNIRAGSKKPGEQVVPVQKQSQRGSSFKTHKVRGTGPGSRVGFESRASWRDEMDRMYGDISISKFFKKSSGGDINNTMKTKKYLSGGQAKIAAKAPPPNKIDEKDFAVLREEKAKGRGMGLQDEKVQPGKVQKAVLGKIVKGVKSMFKGKGRAASSGGVRVVGGGSKGMGSMLPKLLRQAIADGTVKTAKKGKMIGYKSGSGLDLPVINKVKPTVHKDKRSQNLARMKEQFNKQKSRSGQNPNKTLDSPKAADKFLKRRKALAGIKSGIKALGKAGRVGAVGAAILSAGYGAAKLGQTIGRKMSEKKDKKMGGGMMKKYSKGGGADSGRIGEMKSRLAVAQDKLAGKVSQRDYDKIKKKTKVYALAQSKKNKDRLTDRDIEKASNLIGKRGGGMMMKPMGGYRTGTMVKARGCKLGRSKPTKIT